MKLSAPIYRLKRKARLMSREDHIPLHDALDCVALEEGFSNWSLLIAKLSKTAPASKLYPQLRPGDLVLVGARPGQGKTLMCLELALQAIKSGNRSAFFTLEYTAKDVLESFRSLGVDWSRFEGQFEFDGSNEISAGYIVGKLSLAPPGTLVVVDYLQLLDQRRENPELAVQIRMLKSFAEERGLIIVFISQIDRTYDPSKKRCPDLQDIRLPNPLDLKLFSKMCFLNNGVVQFNAVH